MLDPWSNLVVSRPAIPNLLLPHASAATWRWLRGLQASIMESNRCSQESSKGNYNSAILSRLLTRYEASGSTKALAMIKKISPAAWRHILLNGHYTFRSDGKVIDLDAIVAGLALG